jgi:hypothetical protein
VDKLPQSQDPLPPSSNELPAAIPTPVNIPSATGPKEQFKYGDAKVTSPGVGKVTIVIH